MKRVSGFLVSGWVGKQVLGLAGMVMLALPGLNVALASDQTPSCMDHGRVVAENDAQVIEWKHSTKNQFKARAHVHGQVDRIFSDHTGHNHFEIQIGPNSDDTLEVVYNQDFGALPDIAVGMDVEACGDYITSNAAAGPYPASPSGAIIHWIHANPSGHGHDSGYLMIDGILYGQGRGSANPQD